MTRVLVVDDHPAVRAGVVALLRSEPGLNVVAAAADCEEALARARRDSPEVALVDFNLASGDGLSLTLQLKQAETPPAVLIYSAFADRRLAVAAVVAGADGVLPKGAPPDELFGALRTVARGGTCLPALTPDAMDASTARLPAGDLPILGMRLDRTPPDEIGQVLGLSQREVRARIATMLGRLMVPATP